MNEKDKDGSPPQIGIYRQPPDVHRPEQPDLRIRDGSGGPRLSSQGDDTTVAGSDHTIEVSSAPPPPTVPFTLPIAGTGDMHVDDEAYEPHDAETLPVNFVALGGLVQDIQDAINGGRHCEALDFDDTPELLTLLALEQPKVMEELLAGATIRRNYLDPESSAHGEIFANMQELIAALRDGQRFALVDYIRAAIGAGEYCMVMGNPDERVLLAELAREHTDVLAGLLEMARSRQANFAPTETHGGDPAGYESMEGIIERLEKARKGALAIAKPVLDVSEQAKLTQALLEAIDHGKPCPEIAGEHYEALVALARQQPVTVQELLKRATTRRDDVVLGQLEEHEIRALDSIISDLEVALLRAGGKPKSPPKLPPPIDPPRVTRFTQDQLREQFAPRTGGRSGVYKPRNFKIFVPNPDGKEVVAEMPPVIKDRDQLLTAIGLAIEAGDTSWNLVFTNREALAAITAEGRESIDALINQADTLATQGTEEQVRNREAISIALRAILEKAGQEVDPAPPRGEIVGGSQAVVGALINAAIRDDAESGSSHSHPSMVDFARMVEAFLRYPAGLRGLLEELGRRPEGVSRLVFAIESGSPHQRAGALRTLRTVLERVTSNDPDRDPNPPGVA